jgi:peptidoglycan/xylan/chitin deacetylase (PgdA/CDA1 family)
MPSTTKPIASLSLDLDNQWSYLKTHGDSAWVTLPSYFDRLIPRVLTFLAERQLQITFFVVGQDAALPHHTDLLAALAQAGHEIGNHSYHHEPWLHLYSEAQIDEELARTEEVLVGATGQRPIGFRGPGYSCSAATLRVLVRRGYHYDASTLPTFLGPLARLYYLLHSKLSAEEEVKRKLLFGTLRDGLRPLRPYRWGLPELPAQPSLVELPVTTMPLVKIPIHFSYLLYLSGYSTAVALGYFATALRLCRLTGVQPSLLLHPLDFLGANDVQALAFFPGMHLSHRHKLQVVSAALRLLTRHFSVIPMREHARQVSNQPILPIVDAQASFAQSGFAQSGVV